MIDLKIIIITGLSGSGKSTTLAAFEDAGLYCVDNMPVALLPKFIELPLQKNQRSSALVFVMDLRAKGFLEEHRHVFNALTQKGYSLKILFLEAEEKVLLQRFNQTRRHHPMAQGRSLKAAIRNEKKQLSPLKEVADIVIDTSDYTVHELKAIILDIARKTISILPLKIYLRSFGYKYGSPNNVDLMFDVRCLVNPYFVPDLKPLDGLSESIKKFVLKNTITVLLLEKLFDLLDYLIPLYEKEGKAYLTIAIGCTGGRHRSVAVAESLLEHLSQAPHDVTIAHRDIHRA